MTKEWIERPHRRTAHVVEVTSTQLFWVLFTHATCFTCCLCQLAVFSYCEALLFSWNRSGCRSDTVVWSAVCDDRCISALVFAALTCVSNRFPSKFFTLLFWINFVATNTTMTLRAGGGFVVEIDSSDDEQVDIMGVSHDSTLCEIFFDPENE